MPLPKDVIQVKNCLKKNDPDKLRSIADKLIADSPELTSMWKTLERKKADSNDLWVWAFLSAAKEASTLPAFHYTSSLKRRELSDKIERYSRYLSDILKQNNLDGQLFHNDGKMFHGFYIYEDYGESNRARIDNAKIPKISVSRVIQRISERAREKIANEPIPGKAGRNNKVIRFIRIISNRNVSHFDSPLNKVTATAANAIFGTNYTAFDITKLRNR